MKESHEKGAANHSAPSFAYCTVRCSAKRKQGIGGLGIELRKDAIRTPTPLRCAEGYMRWGDIASPSLVLRSQRPQTRLETSCTRTGRPRRRLRQTKPQDGGRRPRPYGPHARPRGI